MATNILSNQTLAEGIVYSDTISNATDIDLQAVLSTDAEGSVNYTIERRTSDTSHWRTAKDSNGQPITFKTTGPNDDGLNISGLNAYAVRVKVKMLAGCTGTLNLEYN